MDAGTNASWIVEDLRLPAADPAARLLHQLELTTLDRGDEPLPGLPIERALSRSPV